MKFDGHSFSQWVKQMQHNAGLHRVVVILSGEHNLCVELIETFVNDVQEKHCLWVSQKINNAIHPRQARTQLGREYDAIVFDAHDVFDIDAFGAVTGTLKGGGVLFLLIPELNEWQELQNSRFLKRAVTFFQDFNNVVFIDNQTDLPGIDVANASRVEQDNLKIPYRTLDQQNVVEKIIDNASTQQKVPVVLISDRGRGKSSALGLAAGQLLKDKLETIIVTAPRLSVSEPVFQHAKTFLDEATVKPNKIIWQNHQLKFVAPDELILEQPKADLLFVDEAASIPLPMLENMLTIYPTCVFATTIHGYEGTGRGFTLKFNKMLDRANQDWQQYEMQTPIRWASDDPVEKWVDQLLCLDADLDDVSELNHLDKTQFEVIELNRDELFKDDEILSSLFALLVYAHYRTKPSDLQHLLDDPMVRVYVLKHERKILAALLINQEGGFSKNLSEEIYKGNRRPAGNLLPQTLCFHAGYQNAAELTYARIMRIAVHPELQGQGLGTALLNGVMKKEQEKNVDAIGTSFGATAELMHFWQKADFEIVRMGFTRDHSSGTHSAVLLKPFSLQAKTMFDQLREKFQYYVKAWLAESLADVSAEMKLLLEQEIKQDAITLSDSDWQDIESYTETHRGFEACMWPLTKLLNQYPDEFAKLSEPDQQLVDLKIRQRVSWTKLARQTKQNGKAQVQESLKSAIREMVKIIRQSKIIM